MIKKFQEAYRRALGLGEEPEPTEPEPETPDPHAPRTAAEWNRWISEQEEKYFGPPPPPERQWKIITEPKRY